MHMHIRWWMYNTDVLQYALGEGKKKEKTTECIWRGSMGILCQLIP
jgi:hypothetical protein